MKINVKIGFLIGIFLGCSLTFGSLIYLDYIQLPLPASNKDMDLEESNIQKFGSSFEVGTVYEFQKGRTVHLSGKLHADYTYSKYGTITMLHEKGSADYNLKKGEKIWIENCLLFIVTSINDDYIRLKLLEKTC